MRQVSDPSCLTTSITMSCFLRVVSILLCLFIVFATPESNLMDASFSAAEILEEHNTKRFKHRAPPLIWHHLLAQRANEVVNRIKDEWKCRYFEEPRRGLTVHVSKFRLTPSKLVSFFYSGAHAFDFEKRLYLEPVSNVWAFPNMIWRESKAVGCAVARCSNGHEAWACEYYPPAYIETFAENIFPLAPKFDMTHWINENSLEFSDVEDESVKGRVNFFKTKQRGGIQFFPDALEESSTSDSDYDEKSSADYDDNNAFFAGTT